MEYISMAQVALWIVSAALVGAAAIICVMMSGAEDQSQTIRRLNRIIVNANSELKQVWPQTDYGGFRFTEELPARITEVKRDYTSRVEKIHALDKTITGYEDLIE